MVGSRSGGGTTLPLVLVLVAVERTTRSRRADRSTTRCRKASTADLWARTSYSSATHAMVTGRGGGGGGQHQSPSPVMELTASRHTLKHVRV